MAGESSGSAKEARRDPFRMPRRLEELLDEPLPRFLRRKPSAFRHWAFSPWALREWAYDEGAWLPPIDVIEKNGVMTIRADLPGVKLEEVKVSAKETSLIIEGKRQEDPDVHDEDYHVAERISGDFRRAVSIPGGIDANAITASYKDGVLEVRIPLGPKRASGGTTIKVNAQ
ncbi:MAG: Hsp20/alpha crystallin family protein [Chloroflexi bacterium]|nr:Hsp20/alpha crystallin family protein [Chloroflexota bacterium]